MDQGVLFDSTILNQFEMLSSRLIHERALKILLSYNEKLFRENNAYRKSKSRSSQFNYRDVMNNMKILSVVTSPSIYHG